MRIVWDEPRRRANLAKHEIDFADFRLSSRALVLPAPRSPGTGRERHRLVQPVEGGLVRAVVSPLESQGLSLVSLRAASREERRAYDER